MTSRDFCYWLQGYFEIAGAQAEGMSPDQIKSVRAHLAMVFKHEIDPSMGSPEKQEQLNHLHGNKQGVTPRC